MGQKSVDKMGLDKIGSFQWIQALLSLSCTYSFVMTVHVTSIADLVEASSRLCTIFGIMSRHITVITE